MRQTFETSERLILGAPRALQNLPFLKRVAVCADWGQMAFDLMQMYTKEQRVHQTLHSLRPVHL